MVVVVDDFNEQAEPTDLQIAVINALERIRLRMEEMTLEPTRDALRQAASEVFADGITPELAEALRPALHRWNERISHLYTIEPVLFGGRLSAPPAPTRSMLRSQTAIHASSHTAPPHAHDFD